MPVTSEHPQTEGYYLAQAALGASVAQQVATVAEGLDPVALASTFDELATLAAEIASDGSLVAIGQNVDFYEAFRADLGLRDGFRAPVVAPLTIDGARVRVSASTGDLLTAADSVVDEIYLAELTLQIQAEAEAVTQAAVADTGRDQFFAALRADGWASGWVRVARANACSFCRMLATRGPIYSKFTATFRAHTVVNGRGGVCQCTAEPLIGESYEPTAQARADAALWQRIAEAGHKGADARNEFRRHLEGRADGPRAAPRRGEGPTRPMTPTTPLGFDHLTPAQLRHHLSVLERLRDTDYKRKQVARIAARLKALGDPA